MRAQTDITSSLVAVADVSGDFVRVIYDGSLAQGGHRFFWDGRNESGAVVVAGQYIIVFYIDSISGKTIENTSLNNQEPEEGWWSEFVEGFTIGITLGISFLLDVIFSEENTGLGNVTITDSSPNPSKFYLSGQFRVVCFTYTNEELNIESRPSLGLKKRIYFWHTEDEDPPEFDVDIELISRNRPPWATHINIYVSENPTTLLQQNELLIKAIETGFDFFRIGIIEVSENTLSDYEGVIDSSSLRLDSFEHDGPVEGFHTIGAYGVGLWGAAKNRVYFSKIGNNGEQRIYALPSENALVPHSFPLSRSGQSLIQYIHPAAHDSALLVFKRDAIHVIRGKGVISGLYDPNTIVEVDIDASQVMEGVGTMSPRSVLTVGSAVYFVGSDNRFYQYGMNWRGQTEVRDVGLPIQRYLNEFDVVELQNLVAFLYGNSYCLITPERVIIMDMNRKYWTTASWRLKDAFWSRGGIQAESILYGLTQDDELVELFKGETDGENTIGWLWRSNPVLIPSESSITGILAVHTTTPSPTINCRVDIDDVIGEAEEFIPEKSNDFRCGIHGYGSRFSVQLEGSSEPPLLDRIEAEVFPVP